MARASRPVSTERVVLADEPAYPDRQWSSPYETDPFDVPDAEKVATLLDLTERLKAGDGVAHTRTSFQAVRENVFYADLAGTSTTQTRVRIEPELPRRRRSTARPGSFETMRTLAPPAAAGWEYVTSADTDLAGEIAEIPELLAAKIKAPSVRAGDYDLVIDGSNLFLTIHESIGHATELDRVLGYEAAYAGTSFATFDKLGTFQYGSPVMNVTGDRDTDWGLASVGWDDEGVAGQHWDIVKDGILVGYQTDRAMAALKDLGRSNGAAYADSARHVPLQRMVNVSLQPDPEGGTLDDLVGQVENGIYIVGDKSWSIDMQRYNFQFTGQRFFAIENGRLSGQLRDVAYQATTTDFWRSMEAVGGPSTFYRAARSTAARPSRARCPRPATAHPRPSSAGVRHPQHGAGGRTLMTRLDSPQDVVEAALAAATTDGTVVIVTDRSEANLRWANSSLTTNGEMSSRSVTVIATNGSAGGTSAGVVGRTVTDAEAVRELVAEAEAGARAAEPAPDAAPLVTPDQAGVGQRLRPRTGDDERRRLRPGGRRPRRRVRRGRYGPSALRVRRAGGRLGLPRDVDRAAAAARAAHGSAGDEREERRLVGVELPRLHLRDPAEADVVAADADLTRRLGWAERRLDLPAGRYETILPPTALADLLVEAYWESGARAADEGRSAYSGKPASGCPGCRSSCSATRPGRALECAPFVVAAASTADVSVFDNGLPLPRQDVLAKGELVSLTGTRAYASSHETPIRLGVDNLVLEAPGATGGLDDLVATTQRGLLLSTIWYVRVVDPQTLLLTGLTRDGVYLVEDGEVVGAVNNFRWNESPLDVLDRITEVGATERCYPREWGDYFTRAAMPPVRVSDFNMSSVSAAQ